MGNRVDRDCEDLGWRGAGGGRAGMLQGEEMGWG